MFADFSQTKQFPIAVEFLNRHEENQKEIVVIHRQTQWLQLQTMFFNSFNQFPQVLAVVVSHFWQIKNTLDISSSNHTWVVVTFFQNIESCFITITSYCKKGQKLSDLSGGQNLSGLKVGIFNFGNLVLILFALLFSVCEEEAVLTPVDSPVWLKL